MKSELVIWILAGLLAVVVIAALVSQLRPSARLRRRLRRTHSPVASKSRRPMVKFSVKPPKK